MKMLNRNVKQKHTEHPTNTIIINSERAQPNIFSLLFRFWGQKRLSKLIELRKTVKYIDQINKFD